MNSAITDHRRTDNRAPTSVWLLRSPLDFIIEDHLRLRAMCAEMDKLAEAKAFQPEAVARLLEYLKRELPLLLDDEDEDLLPRVLRRAETEDELPKLAQRLHKEHAQISAHLDIALAGLESFGPDTPAGCETRDALKKLADATRRHLIFENAVLIPLARARLTQDDLGAMRDAMLRRRGLEDLFSREQTAR